MSDSEIEDPMEKVKQFIRELLNARPEDFEPEQSPTKSTTHIDTITINDFVVFEPRVVYNGTNKELYTFDKSLDALKARGYQRHSRPAEVFALICNSLENKLSAGDKAIVDDMFKSYDEWLSLAMERKGDTLHCYLDPANIVWNGTTYVVQGNLKHNGEKKFSIASLPSQQWIPLATVHGVSSQLVEFLWSRPFAQLPLIIQQNAQLYLPPERMIWPAGRGNFNGRYSVCYNYNYWASRGVRRGK